MKLFEFAVIWNPNPEEVKQGQKSMIIVKPEVVLASDNNSATLLAGRAIPEEYVSRLDQCEVAVRPF